MAQPSNHRPNGSARPAAGPNRPTHPAGTVRTAVSPAKRGRSTAALKGLKWTLELTPPQPAGVAGQPLSLTTHLISGLPGLSADVPLMVLTSHDQSLPIDPAELILALGTPLPQREPQDTRDSYLKRALTAAATPWKSHLDATIHTGASFYKMYGDEAVHQRLAGITGDPEETEETSPGQYMMAITHENATVINLEETNYMLARWNRWLVGSLIYYGSRATGCLSVFTPDMAYDRCSMHHDESEVWFELLHGTSQQLLTREETQALTPEQRRWRRKLRRQRRYTREAIQERREAIVNSEIMSPKMVRRNLGVDLLNAGRYPLSLSQLQQLADHPATTPIQQRQLTYALALLRDLQQMAEEIQRGPCVHPDYNDDTGDIFTYIIETYNYTGGERYHQYTGLVVECAEEEMQYFQENCDHVRPIVTYRGRMEEFPPLLTLVDRFMHAADKFWTLLEDWSALGITPEMTAAGNEIAPTIPKRARPLSQVLRHAVHALHATAPTTTTGAVA